MVLKERVAIVNKIFWPDGTLIGEALLEISKQLSSDYEVIVVAQSKNNLRQLQLAECNRKIFKAVTCQPISDRSSVLVLRILDAIYYMCFALAALIINRPTYVYVSTNPPIFVPYVVSIYCRIVGAKYLYHIQDIHPEAADIVVPMSRIVFNCLRYIDTIVLRHATSIVTLTPRMQNSLIRRGGIVAPISIEDNPANSVVLPCGDALSRNELIYCGSLGRFQNIPLLVDAIEGYIRDGGKLSFLFCGDGVFASRVEALAKKFEGVKYLGPVTPREAAKLVAEHKWAILPTDDRVTEYAFPSKSSTYLVAGCNIFAISGKGGAISEWVARNQVGFVVEPTFSEIVSGLFKIESIYSESNKLETGKFKLIYSMRRFGESIANRIRDMHRQNLYDGKDV